MYAVIREFIVEKDVYRKELYIAGDENQAEPLLSVGGRDAVAEVLGGDVGVGLRSRDNTLVGVDEHRLEHSMVGFLSTPGNRELEPEDEEGLGGKIPGEVVQNRAQRDALGEVERAEYDPVSEPLNIVRVSGGLEGPEREISREAPANKVGDRSSERVEEMEDEEEGDRAANEPRLGHLSALLQLG